MELPTASVYLSEARWRVGDEDGADAAADLAHDAARRQGSNHYLLEALASFPSVVTRRLDSEPRADSQWHELGRALRSQDITVDLRLTARVELVEFGEPVDSRRRHTGTAAENRQELRTARLPDQPRPCRRRAVRSCSGRCSTAARTTPPAPISARPCISFARSCPARSGSCPSRAACRWRIRVIVSSESARLETLLAEAARLQGEQRIDATLRAIAIPDRGQYLPGLSSIWIEERRDRLALVADARQEQRSCASRRALRRRGAARRGDAGPTIRSGRPRTDSRCGSPTPPATRTA